MRTGEQPAPPSGGFAAVLGQVRKAGVASVATRTLGSPEAIEPPAALAAQGLVERQEIAAGLSLQWAALLRDGLSDAGAEGIPTHSMPLAESPGADVAPGQVRIPDHDLPVAEGAEQRAAAEVRIPDHDLPVAEGAEQRTAAAVRIPDHDLRVAEGAEQRTAAAVRIPDHDLPVAEGAEQRAAARHEGLISAGRTASELENRSAVQALAAREIGGRQASRPVDVTSAPGGRTQEQPAYAEAALLAVPALVAWQLSPQLAVITAGQPAASDESLRAFAAAQGFDAHALRRMFGADPAEPAITHGSQGAEMVPESMTTALASDARMPGLPGRFAYSMNPAGVKPAVSGAPIQGSGVKGAPVSGLSLPSSPLAGAVVVEGSAQAQGTEGLSARVLRVGGDAQYSPSGKPIAQHVQSAAAKTASPSAEALQAFSEDGGRVEAIRSAMGAAGSTANAVRAASVGSAATAGAPTVAAAWWALQAQLASASLVGPRDPRTLGAAAALSTAAVPARDGLPGPAQDLSGALPPGALPLVDSSTPTQKSDPVLRQVDAQPLDLREHLEQGHEALSKRLVEALATRLLAQIDKGEWKIRLTVAPQHLGPIDIDLQMRGQRLEAQFQVAHGATQALIQDSLPRLREAVGASGMDLASVWVSGGWSGRDRGNPTPGQPDNPTALALNEEVGDEQTVGATTQVESDRTGRSARPGAVDILI